MLALPFGDNAKPRKKFRKIYRSQHEVLPPVSKRGRGHISRNQAFPLHGLFVLFAGRAFVFNCGKHKLFFDF